MDAKAVLFIAAMVIGLNASCDKENSDSRQLVFIGDSLVAGWDVNYWFPATSTENNGIAGTGVEYLEAEQGNFTGRTVVVISGTNDIGSVSYDSEDDYANRYLTAIRRLGASRTFLFCIFPRSESLSRQNELAGNQRIRQFNSKVKALCDNEPNITYVDVFDNLLYDGALNPEFTTDGLHLTDEGYEVISHILKKLL